MYNLVGLYVQGVMSKIEKPYYSKLAFLWTKPLGHKVQLVLYRARMKSGSDGIEELEEFINYASPLLHPNNYQVLDESEFIAKSHN